MARKRVAAVDAKDEPGRGRRTVGWLKASARSRSARRVRLSGSGSAGNMTSGALRGRCGASGPHALQIALPRAGWPGRCKCGAFCLRVFQGLVSCTAGRKEVPSVVQTPPERASGTCFAFAGAGGCRVPLRRPPVAPALGIAFNSSARR